MFLRRILGTFLRRRLGTYWLLAVLVAVAPGTTAGDLLAQESPSQELRPYDPGRALQNPVLRDHFRRIILERFYGLRSLASPMEYAESYRSLLRLGQGRDIVAHVDLLTRNFLGKLGVKLNSVKTSFRDVLEARVRALTVDSNGGENREARERWERSLRRLAAEADDLRKTLAFPLIELEEKSDFKPAVNGETAQSGYSEEMRFIYDQLGMAEEQLRALFFEAGTHTIEVSGLRVGNPMICLDRVAKVSKKLGERLR